MRDGILVVLHDWNVNLSRGGQNKSQDATQKLLRLKNSSRHFILQENEKLAPTKGPLKPRGIQICVQSFPSFIFVMAIFGVTCMGDFIITHLS